MATRLIHILGNPDLHVTDTSLLFAKSNWDILLPLILISTIYGILLIFFQLDHGHHLLRHSPPACSALFT